jgi:hypothetical protein
VKNILLRGPVFACGEMYDVKAKHQGCGVYEVRTGRLVLDPETLFRRLR